MNGFSAIATSLILLRPLARKPRHNASNNLLTQYRFFLFPEKPEAGPE